MQRQHAADELKTVAAAVNYLSEHGISTLDELDAALSSVSEQADAIRAGMKTAEQRMKELQKLIEYGRNYQTYKPVQDEYRQIRWKGKQEKFAEARRAELTRWNAANRYLHAHLPEGVKTLPISAWEKEYAALKAQRETEYAKLKGTRSDLSELQISVGAWILRSAPTSRNRRRPAPSGTNRSDKKKDGQAVRLVRPKCFPKNGKFSLAYPDTKTFRVLFHYLFKKFYIGIRYYIYYHLRPIMLTPNIA